MSVEPVLCAGLNDSSRASAVSRPEIVEADPSPCSPWLEDPGAASDRLAEEAQETAATSGAHLGVEGRVTSLATSLVWRPLLPVDF